MNYPIEEIRKAFPILHTLVHGSPLIYLDNAATTHMPTQVIHAMTSHALTLNANVHRGSHYLSERSTEEYERARKTVADFIGAKHEEIIFTSGTTDGLNKVSIALKSIISKGDEIIASRLEHNSNYLPWVKLSRETGANLTIWEPDEKGNLSLENLTTIMSERTKIVALTHCSNVSGVLIDISRICSLIRSTGAISVIDGAQGIGHEMIDVRITGCDFYAFSAHKIHGPTGIGVLYANKDSAEELPAPFWGGGMVENVTESEVRSEAMPYRWEAGTPNYIGAVGLAEAINWTGTLGREHVHSWSECLLERTETGLNNIPGVHIIGNPSVRKGCISFATEGIHPFDLAKLLDAKGIAVRSGKLCAHLLLTSLNRDYLLRISPGMFNTLSEIDVFLTELKKSMKLLGGRR